MSSKLRTVIRGLTDSYVHLGHESIQGSILDSVCHWLLAGTTSVRQPRKKGHCEHTTKFILRRRSISGLVLDSDHRITNL